jgi:ribonucleoside-diphosphate reductase beta chain
MALIDPITDYAPAAPGEALADAFESASPVGAKRPTNILDPGYDLTLRPMRYPQFFDMYRDAIKNTWTVEEIDFSDDLVDLQRKLMPAEKHLVGRLVAFFATGDSIVSNNLVLNLYQHINAPEARMYLSRQLYEEALHVQFYLTLLDNYIPDMAEREAAFAAVENIPSIRAKAEFCFKWIDSIQGLQKIETPEQRKQFLLNLICFATCIEGLFFFAAFAYVYFLRSKGLLNGLADGTNWVFRDESCHMNFAFEVVDTVRKEQPELFDDGLEADIREMLNEAIDCEHLFAADVLGEGVPGMSLADTRTYLEFVADQRLAQLGYGPGVRLEEPVQLHGAAGRAGPVELLRAHGQQLSGRRRRRRRLRRRVLIAPRGLTPGAISGRGRCVRRGPGRRR